MTTTNAATAAVPEPEEVEAEAETEASPSRLLDHAYDGIREYDNPLPGWWSSIFIGSIIFAGFYGLYFHVTGWGATPEDKYKSQLVGYDSKRELRERAELANVSEEYLVQQVGDSKVLARGKAVFVERCVSCHGPEGAGAIGPNLTDEYQRQGSSRLDLYKTVRGGVPGSAMTAWGDQLPPADILAATAFVVTLRGTNVRGKPPEGVPVQPFKK